MRKSYTEVLENKVEIPIIQRDYAQGRTDAKTNKVRKDFLDVLFEHLKKKNENNVNTELDLDFIYGFGEDKEKNNPTFIPIDGQQRLTTLWLLYWYVAAKEKIAEEEKAFLSNFIYETRHSTTVFCQNLLKLIPDLTGANIVEHIKDQSWYFEIWNFDPSIQAMLIMLDDIENRYASAGISSIWNLISGANCPFYFYKLDMDSVGLSDDLYIKMNSRGKGLTEFEYFKAGFTELLKDQNQKDRFNDSIDRDWTEAIWSMVMEIRGNGGETDLALIVDSCFLNVFNFITSVIAFKNELGYTNTVNSAKQLKTIYSDKANQQTLFETFDAISSMQENHSSFWKKTFYCEKNNFVSTKTRLFFQHKEVDLLRRCLFHFAESKGFSFPEHLLLHACLTHIRTQSKDFGSRIRVIRNLVANSEYQLREVTLGKSFKEVEDYIINGNADILENFKTDQIEEEKKKEAFLKQSSGETNTLRKLEDSDLIRGSISLFSLDQNFSSRAEKFLELFDEDEFVNNYKTNCNLLLCFGDYLQDENGWTNHIAPNKTGVRSFFTSPGYNKVQLYSKTQKVLFNCLDYFITNPTSTTEDKINERIVYYDSNPKDWIYYFIKYPSFRERCNKGYYFWLHDTSDYIMLKMKEKRFSGYHWDPFLFELKHRIKSEKLSLENYNNEKPLILSINKKAISITTIPTGFLFANAMTTVPTNAVLDDLINKKLLNKNGELLINQNSDGIDLEDRIEALSKVILNIIKK